MSERDQSPAAPRHDTPAQPPLDWREDTAPGGQAAGGSPYSGGAHSGAPYSGASYSGAQYSGAGASPVGAGGAGGSDAPTGTGAHGQRGQDEQYYTAPQYSTTPVPVRRPDVLAALLLVLAGIAAAISLLVDWVRDANGWDLLKDGFENFDAGTWPFPVVILAGGALLVLGLLMFVPARGHRTLGVLALLATMAALCAVVVLFNAVRWTTDLFEVGFWIVCGVPVLGLLGSLKAMLTGPKVR